MYPPQRGGYLNFTPIFQCTGVPELNPYISILRNKGTPPEFHPDISILYPPIFQFNVPPQGLKCKNVGGILPHISILRNKGTPPEFHSDISISSTPPEFYPQISILRNKSKGGEIHSQISILQGGNLTPIFQFYRGGGFCC
jgi:hypothetical protein